MTPRSRVCPGMDGDSEDDDSGPPLPLGAGDDELGEVLHAWLLAEYGHETEAWPVERVSGIMARLERVRAACPVPGACPRPLACEILWAAGLNAFAAPGRYVYITRALLQEGTDEAPIAFVLAHEMAHHDLGHVALLRGWARRLVALPEGRLRNAAARLVRSAEWATYSAEMETAADSYALDLCLAAGYDGPACLGLFDVLRRYLLDHRDIDGVYGPDDDMFGAGPFGEWARRNWRRARGYPPVSERREALRARLRDDYGLRV